MVELVEGGEETAKRLDKQQPHFRQSSKQSPVKIEETVGETTKEEMTTVEMVKETGPGAGC